jgi:hypothetical protein
MTFLSSCCYHALSNKHTNLNNINTVLAADSAKRFHNNNNNHTPEAKIMLARLCLGRQQLKQKFVKKRKKQNPGNSNEITHILRRQKSLI